jgi:hypothetical protein
MHSNKPGGGGGNPPGLVRSESGLWVPETGAIWRPEGSEGGTDVPNEGGTSVGVGPGVQDPAESGSAEVGQDAQGGPGASGGSQGGPKDGRADSRGPRGLPRGKAGIGKTRPAHKPVLILGPDGKPVPRASVSRPEGAPHPVFGPSGGTNRFGKRCYTLQNVQARAEHEKTREKGYPCWGRTSGLTRYLKIMMSVPEGYQFETIPPEMLFKLAQLDAAIIMPIVQVFYESQKPAQEHEGGGPG